MITITVNAAIKRINRRLAHECQALKKSRSVRAYVEYGNYYVLDYRRNQVLRGDIDIEELARKLGVLKFYETVEE